jgi:hypothetical protein
MTIEVLTNYGGKNTRERRILPGVYEDGDERLFGLSQYLVTHGFARVIGEKAPEIGSTVATPPVAVYAPVQGSPDDTWQNVGGGVEKITVVGKDGTPLTIVSVTDEVEQPTFNTMTKAELIDFAATHSMTIDLEASKTAILEAVKTQWENTR